MMLFLIDYDRKLGRLVTLQKFADSERAQASSLRLQLELDYHRRKIEREVVLLDAPDEAAIRKTHRRYFADLAELAKWPENGGQ